MALSFRRNGDGSFGLTIPKQDRELLQALVPQMRELISDRDQLTWRLFPNPYPQHDKAADEYQDLIGDDLTDRHVAALDTLESTLEAKRIDEDQMTGWMHAVNHLRLVIGTRLDVQEETEIEDFSDEIDQSLFITYMYLGSMLELIVRAVAGADYE